MMVWLHTNSPPQHIATITEAEIGGRGGIAAYRRRINERRAINAQWIGLFEGDKAELTVHIFDTNTRADAWMERNQGADLIYGTDA